MKIIKLLSLLILTNCAINKENSHPNNLSIKINEFDLKREAEIKRSPLKIYIIGAKFGFGAIIYVENYGQTNNQLILDENNIGITSYPFSTIIKSGGSEYKYQYFRIIKNDTIPLFFYDANDSLSISSATPTAFKSSKMKNEYRYIQFYAGKYPERPIGIHIDSTEIGKFENLIEQTLINLDKNNVSPQK
jgi:hypothetical protein